MNRHKRTLLCLAMLLLAVGGIGAVWLFFNMDDGINQATCDKIQPGMTPAEVEEIFDRAPSLILPIGGSIHQEGWDKYLVFWDGRNGCVDVLFQRGHDEKEDEVVSVRYSPGSLKSDYIVRVHKWFGL